MLWHAAALDCKSIGCMHEDVAPIRPYVRLQVYLVAVSAVASPVESVPAATVGADAAASVLVPSARAAFAAVARLMKGARELLTCAVGGAHHT